MAGRRTVKQLEVNGLAFTLTRKRVRNINLRVQRDGTVTVSAPARISEADILAFVDSRQGWIERAQQRVMRSRRSQVVRCDEGASLTLWGNPLTLHLTFVPAQGRWPRCAFHVAGERLLVEVDARLAANDEKTCSRRTELLERWLHAQLEERVHTLAPACEQTVGRKASSWHLKHMSSRWGSCNVQTAAINLATSLVHYPERCLEYAMLHELCHLHEPSHNARFQALMDQFCPSWRGIRQELNGTVRA